MSRYLNMFKGLKNQDELAFVPFVTIGDMGKEGSLSMIRKLIDSGADALELGIPFSDPLADGLVIQGSNKRALEHGINTDDCFHILKTIRQEYPDVPIGLLTYANLVHAYPTETFYKTCMEVGVDSVLVADVPIREKALFHDAAERFDIDTVYIAAPNTPKKELMEIASSSKGYVYMVSRAGVTGDQKKAVMPESQLIANLQELSAAPCLLGFGISSPDDVYSARRAGVAGVISGSAVVRIIEEQKNDFANLLNCLGEFVINMKKACKS